MVYALGMKSVHTPTLEIAYLEHGPHDGPPVILLHGFPYDVHAYDEVAPPLAAEGCRVLVPWLRGYGPTRFLKSETPRSGEQAALGNDLRQFMDALALEQATLVGYDWGGRAACVVSALWPERVRGLVSCAGYNMFNTATMNDPAPADREMRNWYQYYFHLERGVSGLKKNRRDIARLLWTLWSPNWKFDDETFERTAKSFDNPDFVAVVIQSYRHRYGNAPGDPALLDIEALIASHQ
jgi:pimeloyl-ACP methyl ester carboxylesterase